MLLSAAMEFTHAAQGKVQIVGHVSDLDLEMTDATPTQGIDNAADPHLVVKSEIDHVSGGIQGVRMDIMIEILEE